MSVVVVVVDEELCSCEKVVARLAVSVCVQVAVPRLGQMRQSNQRDRGLPTLHPSLVLFTQYNSYSFNIAQEFDCERLNNYSHFCNRIAPHPKMSPGTDGIPKSPHGKAMDESEITVTIRQWISDAMG